MTASATRSCAGSRSRWWRVAQAFPWPRSRWRSPRGSATRRRRSTCAPSCSAATSCCWCASGAAAERETLEESGYRVRASKLLALLDKSRHAHPPSLDYTYKVLIACRLEGGEPATSHEIDAVGFFPRTAIPELDLDRTTPGQIELAWGHHEDPSRPTDFD